MKQIQSDYIVNENTIALLPAKRIECDTIVLEHHQTLYIRKTPLDIIKAACYDNWHTYEGRRNAVIHHTNFKKKTPIPISSQKGMYLFPTHSPQHFENIWISYQHIAKTIEISRKPAKSKVKFYNKMEFIVDVSHYILRRQMQRTFECMYRMEGSSVLGAHGSLLIQ